MFNIAMSCTLVTAYYAINSKFPKEQYVNWMRTLLQLNTPIVLFTQDHMEDLIRDLRGNRLLHLVVLPFQQLTTWSLYKNHWIKSVKNALDRRLASLHLLLSFDKPTEKAIPYEAYPEGPPTIVWESDEMEQRYHRLNQ